jgi:hypothetical protein
MTAQVISISTACSSRTMSPLDRDAFRENALQHFYRAERDAKVPAELAYDRMKEFEKTLIAVDRAMMEPDL